MQPLPTNKTTQTNICSGLPAFSFRRMVTSGATLAIALLSCLSTPIAAVQAQGNAREIPEAVTIPLQPEHPSLYWHIEEYSEGLVESWSVDNNQRVVKITIDPVVWFAADYLQRYAVLQKLGLVTGDDNYGILLQEDDQSVLATYIQKDGKWEITPVYLGATPFRPERRFFNPFTP